MSYAYILNGDRYVLTDDGEPVGPPMDQVAIAFSRDDGVLHKHGSITVVSAWAAKARQRLNAAGLNEMSEGIIVLSGRYPLEELNRCLDTSGYVGRFYERLLAPDSAGKQLSPT